MASLRQTSRSLGVFLDWQGTHSMLNHLLGIRQGSSDVSFMYNLVDLVLMHFTVLIITKLTLKPNLQM